MANQPGPATTSVLTSVERSGAECYVARQPILDANGRVHGYELLLRDGPEAVFCGDVDTASCALLDGTVVFGLERFTGGLPGFIHCTPQTLTERLVQVLPPTLTVLVVPDSIEPAPQLVEACLELKAAGFRIALDDYTGNPQLQQLAECADYLSVDFSLLSSEARGKFHLQSKPNQAVTIARKVESQEDYRQALAAGFTLFQGAFFCQPVVLKNRKVPANRFFQFELLRCLNREPIDLKKISELVLRDAAITYRLLRLVNSPVFAIRREVTSIESALLIVGETTFRRIATLAILSELNAGQPSEILHMALLRGRFCALAAEGSPLEPAEQYLLGLLSLLPAMLGLPMDALTPSLPLRSEIREALEGTPNPERCLLEWIEFHELGDWVACDALVTANNLNREHLVHVYSDAVDWAKVTLAAAG